MRRRLPVATLRGTLVALIAIVTVPLVVVGGSGVLHDYRDRRDAEIEANAEIARAVALAVEAFVVDVMRVEQTLGVTSADHPAARIEADLRAVVAEHPEIRDMSWIEPDGAVRVSTEPALAGRSGRWWPPRSTPTGWARSSGPGREAGGPPWWTPRARSSRWRPRPRSPGRPGRRTAGRSRRRASSAGAACSR